MEFPIINHQSEIINAKVPLCRLPENAPMEEALTDVIRRMDERLQH